MKNDIELECSIHNKRILFVSDILDENKKLTRCESCQLDNQNLTQISNFFEEFELQYQNLQQIENEQNQIVNEKSKKIKASLFNFQEDFQDLQYQICDSINQIPNQIQKDCSGQLPYNHESPSLNNLEKSCLTIKSLQQHIYVKKNINSYFQNSKELLEKMKQLLQQQLESVNEIIQEMQYSQITYECEQEVCFKNDVFQTFTINNDLDQPQLALALNSQIRLYDLLSMDIQAQFEIEFQIRDIIYSEDNSQMLIQTSENGIVVYVKQENTYNKQKHFQLVNQQQLKQVLITKNNQEIIVSVGQNLVVFNQQLYPKESSFIQEMPLKGHTDTINQIQFTQDQNKLISCSNDQTALIWSKSSIEWLIESKIQMKNPVFGSIFIKEDQILLYVNAIPQIRKLHKLQDNNEFYENQQIELKNSEIISQSDQFISDKKGQIILVKQNQQLYLIDMTKQCQNTIKGSFSKVAFSKNDRMVCWDQENSKIIIQKQQQSEQKSENIQNSKIQSQTSNFIKGQSFDCQKSFMLKALQLNLFWFIIYFALLYCFMQPFMMKKKSLQIIGCILIITMMILYIFKKFGMFKSYKLRPKNQRKYFFLSTILFSIAHSQLLQGLEMLEIYQNTLEEDDFIPYIVTVYQYSNLLCTILVLVQIFFEKKNISYTKMIFIDVCFSLFLLIILRSYDLKWIVFLILFNNIYLLRTLKQIQQGKFSLQTEEVMRGAIVLNQGFLYPFSAAY